MDQYVANANSHNAPVQFHMEYAPPWATGSVGCGGGGGSATECTGPITDLGDMDAFLAAVVMRYDGSHGNGSVTDYEVSNEPFTGEQSYSGTKAQFATEHNRMRADILAANPNAKVGCCGEASPEDSFVSGGTMDQLWGAGLSKNWGFISIHLYPHHMDDGPEIVVGTCVPDNGGSNEHGLMGSANCVKQGMARNGVSSSTPIYNTEGSWGDTTYTNCINNWGGGSSSVGCQNGSDALKSAFVSRYLLESWASGISRTAWYAYDEGSWGTLGTESKAAWQQTYNWMVGSTMTSPCAIQSGTVWTCGLTLSDGTLALAVWNTAGSSSFTVSSSYSEYSNLAGNTSAAGSSVTIGIAPILLRGSTTSTAPNPPTALTAIVH